MNIIKSIYYAWRSYKCVRKLNQNLLKKMFNNPEVYARAAKDINCIIDGHEWVSEFDPKAEIRKPLNKRVYCKKCGIYYHKHEYHNKQE